MRCEKCGFQGRDGANFCYHCGNALSRVNYDGSDGLRVEEESANGPGPAVEHFCYHCGKPVLPVETDDQPTAAAEEGESPPVSSIDETTTEEQLSHILGGRYELKEMLGRGGMGVVYRAYDQQLRMDIAIKFLLDRYVSDPHAVESLKLEAKAAMQLAHPNIVRLYNFEDTPRAKYILMEFIPGESLASIASRKSDRRFTEAEVINYISKTCEALTYAHQQGVVHRDIKPSNIIILPGDHVKLADFGIAHIKEAATSRMNGGGTPVYMSPEQILNKETDARTDIYSLGVTMYEMLAGNPPFRGPEVRDDHVHAVPKPIPDATDWMNAIIMKCLKKEPAGRWINANELKDVLTRQKEIEVGFQTVFRPAWARAEDDRKMTPPATPSEKIVEKQVEPPPVRRVAVDRTPIRSSGAHKRVAPRPARTIPTHLAPEREQMRIGLGILVGFLAGLLFAGMASGGPSDGFNTILFQLSWIVYGGLIGIAIGIAQKRIVKGLLSFVLGTSGGLAAAFVGGLVTGFPSLDNWAAFPHSLLCGALVGAFIGIADGFYEMSFRYTFNCFLWGTLGGILAVAAFVVVRIVCSPVWTPAFAWIVMGAALGFFINLLIASVEKPVEESPRPYKDL